MGTVDNIFKALKPIVAFVIGLGAMYYTYIYLGTGELIIPVVFGIFVAILIYLITTEKKAGSDVINAGRMLLGLIFGIVVAYSIYNYYNDVMYGIGAAVITIPICIFLTSRIGKGGGFD